MEPLNQKSHPVQVTLPNLLKHLQSVLLPPGAPPPSNVQPHPLPPSQLHPPQLHAETASLSQTVSSVPQPRVAEQLNDASALGRPRVGHAQSSQDVVPPAAPGRRQPSVALAQDIRSRQEGETRGSLSSSQLMQPVPLDMLIQHNILEPGPQTLTCTILVCYDKCHVVLHSLPSIGL